MITLLASLIDQAERCLPKLAANAGLNASLTGCLCWSGALYLGCDGWGGWDSNPRPTDYETERRDTICGVHDLHR